MNFDIVEKIIQYIEENYHDYISNEIINEQTGNSAGYVRNEFKKVANISIEEYRIRRQLALIIQEIKVSNKNIKDSNLLPWSNESGFTKAFKNKYRLTPKRFINNYRQNLLQGKIDINELMLSYNNDKKTIEDLEGKLGSRKNAFLYILSLRPFIIKFFDNLFIPSDVSIKEILIRRKYTLSIAEDFYAGNIPQDFYSMNSRLLNIFYDVKIIRTLSEKLYVKNVGSDVYREYFSKHIVVKDSLKNILLENIEWGEIINEHTSPSDFVTLWYDEIKKEKIEDGMLKVPNELIISNLNMKKFILYEILSQEQGQKYYRTMEELRDYLKFDFNKPIIVDDCTKEIYENECNADSDCLQVRGEKEKYYYYKPIHEILTMDRLCQEIKELFIDGLLYFNYCEKTKAKI